MANVVCVFGAPGSGATTFSLGLALRYAKKKNNVALLLPDICSPQIPALFPQNTKKKEDKDVRSLGKIFQSAYITDTDIMKQFVTVPKTPRFVMLGYAFGENEFTYPTPSESDIYSFYQKLSEMVDVIIVDCSHSVNNLFSKIALSRADGIIKCGDCSFKSVSYFASTLPTMSNNKDAIELTVYCDVKESDNVNEVSDIIGVPDYEIPYFKDLEKMGDEGELLISPYPVKYIKTVDKIIEEMIFVG